jgi:hypothetical protein
MATTFARPVLLPVFLDGCRVEDRPADGYEVVARHYDGRANQSEIQPLVWQGPAELGLLRPLVPLGQSYWVEDRHLSALIARAAWVRLGGGAA